MKKVFIIVVIGIFLSLSLGGCIALPAAIGTASGVGIGAYLETGDSSQKRIEQIKSERKTTTSTLQ